MFISTVIIAIIALQARYNNKMLFFCKIIKKSLFFNMVLSLSISSADPKAFTKALILGEILAKVSNKRCN